MPSKNLIVYYFRILQTNQPTLPEPMGVRVVRATIGEAVGEARPAGDEPSGNRGLVMLPRLQSRK